MLYRCPCEKTRLQCGFVKCCWRCDAIGWVWFRQQISFASPTLLSLKVPSTSREIRLCRQVHPVYSATNFTYLDKLLMYIGLYGIKTHGTSIFVILQWVKGIYIYIYFFFSQESWKELSNEEDEPPEFTPPPIPPPRDPHNGKVEPSFFPENDDIIQQMEIRSLG